MSDCVKFDQHGGVALLTLDRPDSRHNTWGFDMEQQLFDYVDYCDADPTVRVVVLTGSGESFCPGMDIGKLEQLGQGAGVAERTRPPTHLKSLRKPTIAAINGGCAGVGLVQALCCDIRFSATEARLSCSFPRRGAPAEYGSAWLLQRIIGKGRATELLLSGRTFGAEEAADIGLVSQAIPRSDLMETVMTYAASIARQCSPMALEAIKRQLDEGATQGLDEAVRLSRVLAHEPERRRDLAEGARAYAEHRNPDFTPLGPREGVV